MIWFNEDDKLIGKKVISKNQEKIEEFLLTSGALKKLENYTLVSRKFVDKKPSKDIYFSADDTTFSHYFEFLNSKKVEYEYRMTALTTLKLAKEALSRSESPKNTIKLAGFFQCVDTDLKKIESILDNPYCKDFIQTMYPDYAEFLKILPYIEFEQVESYDTAILKEIVKLEESQDLRCHSASDAGYYLRKEVDANNNFKILTKSLEILKNKYVVVIHEKCWAMVLTKKINSKKYKKRKSETNLRFFVVLLANYSLFCYNINQ